MNKKIAPDRKAIESAQEQRRFYSTPVQPAPGTQADRLLNELLIGRPVDPLTAWVKLGIYRLSAVVFELRSAGWSIHTERRPVRNRFGEECRVGFYTLAEGGDHA